MKKTVLNLSAGFILCASLFVLLMQGFGLPSIGPVWDLILRIVAAASVQVLFCVNIKRPWLRLLPLVLTIAFALWGGWMFLTSDSWVHATLGGYLADYCTPTIGCALAYIVCMISKKKLKFTRRIDQ